MIKSQYNKKQNLKPWEVLNQSYGKGKAGPKKPFDEKRINMEDNKDQKQQTKKDKQQVL